MTRPIRPCADCGDPCRGERCAGCYRDARRGVPPPAVNDLAIALTEGHWALVGNVQRWIPDGQPMQRLRLRPAAHDARPSAGRAA